MSDVKRTPPEVYEWLQNPVQLLESGTVQKLVSALCWYMTRWEHPSNFALDFLKNDSGKVAKEALAPFVNFLNEFAPRDSKIGGE